LYRPSARLVAAKVRLRERVSEVFAVCYTNETAINQLTLRRRGRAAHAASILMGLGIEDSGYALATGLLLVICLLCICCVVIELRTCRALNEEERARRRSMRYTGITSGDRSQPIELIGSRPEDERPAGVDWSISMWALERGKYAKGDRGFRA
jgi:hypothetical protein